MSLARALRGLLALCLANSAGAIVAESAQRFHDFDEAELCEGPALTFPEYVARFEKPWKPGTKEYDFRESLFLERARHVREHNCRSEARRWWAAGLGPMADWTGEEIKRLFGYRKIATTSAGAVGDGRPRLFAEGLVDDDETEDAEDQEKLPREHSWGHLVAVKEERMQEDCGSCWAFAAESIMRAHYEIRNAKARNFSVAQMVQCSPNPRHCGGTGGCDGATMELGYEYALATSLVEEYQLRYDRRHDRCLHPYQEGATRAHFLADGSEVHTRTGALDPRTSPERRGGGHKIGMTGWIRFPENKAKRMLQNLYRQGPVGAAVVTNTEWSQYVSGIYKQGKTDWVVTHAVMLYGWGRTITGHKYWRLKNSWGNKWGEAGTMRFLRLDNEEAHCGIDDKPEVGVACDGGPPSVRVCGSLGVLYDTNMPVFLSVASSK